MSSLDNNFLRALAVEQKLASRLRSPLSKLLQINVGIFQLFIYHPPYSPYNGLMHINMLHKLLWIYHSISLHGRLLFVDVYTPLTCIGF
jgi:hypothetical protein